MVVGVRVVYLLCVLVIDLELDEIDALLEEVHVAEVLQVEDEFSARPVRHSN